MCNDMFWDADWGSDQCFITVLVIASVVHRAGHIFPSSHRHLWIESFEGGYLESILSMVLPDVG